MVTLALLGRITSLTPIKTWTSVQKRVCMKCAGFVVVVVAFDVVVVIVVVVVVIIAKLIVLLFAGVYEFLVQTDGMDITMFEKDYWQYLLDVCVVRLRIIFVPVLVIITYAHVFVVSSVTCHCYLCSVKFFKFKFLFFLFFFFFLQCNTVHNIVCEALPDDKVLKRTAKFTYKIEFMRLKHHV